MALSQMTFAAALLVAVVYGGVCNDKKTDCANWARDGECAGDNAKYMAEICPLSCGTCTHSCNDTDVSCGSWAQAGECRLTPMRCSVCARPRAVCARPSART